MLLGKTSRAVGEFEGPFERAMIRTIVSRLASVYGCRSSTDTKSPSKSFMKSHNSRHHCYRDLKDKFLIALCQRSASRTVHTLPECYVH